ncbi:hypothetical protein J2S43_004535 [Catenuloplanes nepalensis]|uniref:Uncharacterized protein n=1 Tax=Catenuloplanes nepalensis TaxID=587533 RepID=A0ABT9MXP0_9ACTN|nr:hypothetical protein [Catenuloplanes nepalensis]MDP9796023.1 hypothetical protein [Catenuloplanes nepalensis]
MPTLSLSDICRDGRFVPIPGGAYFHPGTMADPVDLLALTRAMNAPRPAAGGTIVVPEIALGRPGALNAVRIALAQMPAGAVLTGPNGSLIGTDDWLAATESTGAQAYAPYVPGTVFSKRVVPVDASGRETAGPPAAVRILPPADADARELLRTAAELARDLTRHPADRIRDLKPSGTPAYLLAAGMILTGRPDAWDPGRVTPPALDEVRRTFAGGGTVPLPGSPALVHTPGLTGEKLGWLFTDEDGTLLRVSVDGIAPTNEPAPDATVVRFGPPAATPPPEPPAALIAVLDTLDPWDGVPDCVDRVAHVIGGLGGLTYAPGTEGLRPREVLAARMGGFFGPAGGPGLLNGLGAGTVAPVWVRPAPLADGLFRPGRAAHMVLVHHHGGGRFTLLETQADGAERLRPFTLHDRVLPDALTGTLRLVQDGARRLRQTEVGTRRTVSAPEPAPVDRGVAALTDPPTGRPEPEGAGAEFEPMVRIGRERVLHQKKPAPQFTNSFENLTFVELPSVGLVLKGDKKVVALGRSGRWYGSEAEAEAVEGGYRRAEQWRIIEVATYVGTALPGEPADYPTAGALHTNAKVMIRWLQNMGRYGYSLKDTLSLTPEMAAYFDRWAAGLHRSERAAARQLRDALAEVAPADLPGIAREEKLFHPEHSSGGNLYHSTVDVSLAGIPALHALRRQWVRGRDDHYDEIVRVDEVIAEQAVRIARTFVRQLVDGPLDADDVAELMRGTEAHELRGVLHVVLTHLMTKAYRVRLKKVGLHKNGTLALARYDLDEISEHLPEDVKVFLTRNFGDLVRDLDRSLALRLPGLAGRGERWTEKRMPLSNSTARGPRYKHVLRGALLGDPDRLTPIQRIVGGMTVLEVGAPLLGQPQRFAFELRLHLPDRNSYAPVESQTTLDGTDEYLRHSLDVSRAAERVADQARAWTRANGAARDVAASLSAAHGALTPWHGNVFHDPSGALWEKRNGVWDHPVQLVSEVGTSGRLDGERPVVQHESGRRQGSRRPVLALLSRSRWTRWRREEHLERSSAYLVLARPIGHLVRVPVQREGRTAEAWLTADQFAALLYTQNIGTRFALRAVDGEFADGFVGRVGAEYTALHTAGRMQNLHVYRVAGIRYDAAPPTPVAVLAPGKDGLLATLDPALRAIRLADPPVRRLVHGSADAANAWSIAARGLAELRADFAGLAEPELRARFRDLAFAADKAMELVGELVPDRDHPVAGALLRLDALLGTRRFPGGEWPDAAPPAPTPAERRVRAAVDVLSAPDVGRLLPLLGRTLRASDTDGLRGPDAVAARLGGWFGPAGGVGRLTGLPVGSVTPVRAGERMLLVQRAAHTRFVLADPAADGDARFTAFPFAALAEGDTVRLPAALHGPVRLVTDADGALRHVVVETRRAGASAPESAALTTTDRLTVETLPFPATGRPPTAEPPSLPPVDQPATAAPVDQAAAVRPALTPRDAGPAAGRDLGTPPPAVPVEWPVLVLGEFKAAAGVLDGVRAHGHLAGRPVIAVGLSGPPEVVETVIGRLDAMLRRYARAGVTPLVVAPAATTTGRKRLDETRARRPMITLTLETSGLDPAVWRLRAADGTPVTHASTLVADLFVPAAALPGTVGALPGALAGWLLADGPAEAEAHHRAHTAALHGPETETVLARLAEAAPDDVELAAYRVALDLARRAGGMPEPGAARLRPSVTSILAVEPAYRPGGGAPVTAVYDYLGVTGGRRERYPWEGLLFQLLLAGELTGDQLLALMRATAVTAPDRASIAVVEVFLALRDLPERLLGENPMTHPDLVEIMERIGRVTRGADGSYADCVDPVDRTAWIGRFDDHAARWRATGDPATTRRADLLRLATDLLANC